MATYNVEMNLMNGSSYDILYPTVSSDNFIGILPVNFGGTGVNSISKIRETLGLRYISKARATYIGNGSNIPEISSFSKFQNIIGGFIELKSSNSANFTTTKEWITNYPSSKYKCVSKFIAFFADYSGSSYGFGPVSCTGIITVKENLSSTNWYNIPVNFWGSSTGNLNFSSNVYFSIISNTFSDTEADLFEKLFCYTGETYEINIAGQIEEGKT